MGLLQKLKSVLGLDGGGQRAPRAEPDVTVEREPSADTERAVEQDESTTESSAESPSETPRAPRSASAAGSEGSVESASASESEGSAGEASADEAAGAAGATGDSAEGAATSPDVVEIDGIGPTYADRLRNAGIETVADLAASDVETIASAAETSPSRVEDWLAQAEDN